MNYNTDCNITRKKIENYSYQTGSQIGKGYSSQVFKGKNDITSNSFSI
jgi:predicted Ser/Thr protein kinase